MIKEEEHRRISVHQLQPHCLCFLGRFGVTSVKADGDVGSAMLEARTVARQQEQEGKESLLGEELEVWEEEKELRESRLRWSAWFRSLSIKSCSFVTRRGLGHLGGLSSVSRSSI